VVEGTFFCITILNHGTMHSVTDCQYRTDASG